MKGEKWNKREKIKNVEQDKKKTTKEKQLR